ENLWCNPVWKAQKGEKAELGWWGMELAKRLVDSQKVPLFILNAAVGGTRIDQGADGPTGGYGWETYQRYFVEMSAAWKQDFPNVKQYYVFQIWPNSCGMGGKSGSGDLLREQQRTLPTLYSRMSILATLGIRPPGSCHYPLAGWSEFARLIQPLIERDFYGVVPAAPLT